MSSVKQDKCTQEQNTGMIVSLLELKFQVLKAPSKHNA